MRNILTQLLIHPLSLVNPAFYILTMKQSIQVMIKIAVMLITFVFIVAALFGGASGSGRRGRIRTRQKNWLTLLGCFLMVELLPIPYFTLFIASMTCQPRFEIGETGYKNRMRFASERLESINGGSCDANGSWSLGSNALELILLAQLFVYIIFVYFGKRMNFNDRLKASTFGLK